MNKTVIAELCNHVLPRGVDPSGWLREAPVKAATFVRSIIDGMNRPPRFSNTLVCPRCGSGDARHSRAKSVWEASRRQLTVTAPYRCGKCGYRGWGPDDARRAPRVVQSGDVTSSLVGQVYATDLAAAPARWEQLDFEALNIPRR